MSLSSLSFTPAPAHVVAGHEYQAPGSGAARSPCPFLNTMANHGYINRSGRYVTLWSVTKAMMDCYNFSFPLALFVASAGIYTSAAVGFNPLWFSLDQLKWHGPISVEHDASLSRLDHAEGDAFNPNPDLIEKMITFAKASNGSACPDGLSPENFADYRVFRESTYPVKDLPGGIGTALRCGEVGLIMGALGRGDYEVLGRRINPNWIRSFFGQARLPDDWVRQERPVSLQQVSDTTERVKECMAATREKSKSK
ncbi:Cloroperoxidase [Clavulina sp. PMI_390]|nr:Cloroperoxidase [Clavulina sp. PMI_390]